MKAYLDAVSDTDYYVGVVLTSDRIPKPQRAWEQDDDLAAPSSVPENNTSNNSQNFSKSATPLNAITSTNKTYYSETGNASGVTVSVHVEEEE